LPPDDPWLAQVWRELFCASCAFAAVASLTHFGRQKDPEVPLDERTALRFEHPYFDQFVHHWLWLNQSAGLLGHLSGQAAFTPCRELMGRFGERLGKGVAHGLALRYRVVEAAQAEAFPEGLLDFRLKPAERARHKAHPAHGPFPRRATTSPLDSPTTT
jgi:hypothetical protein